MNSLSNRSNSKSGNVRASPSGKDARLTPPRSIAGDKLSDIFLSVGRKLREGLSNEAEKILIKTLEGYSHSADDFATLKRLLSFYP